MPPQRSEDMTVPISRPTVMVMTLGLMLERYSPQVDAGVWVMETDRIPLDLRHKWKGDSQCWRLLLGLTIRQMEVQRRKTCQLTHTDIVQLRMPQG